MMQKNLLLKKFNLNLKVSGVLDYLCPSYETGVCVTVPWTHFGVFRRFACFDTKLSKWCMYQTLASLIGVTGIWMPSLIVNRI